MGRVRSRSRRDANQKGLVTVLEQLGCSVVDMSAAGIPGWPDLAIGVAGSTHLLEVKNPESAYGRSGLNQNQSAFARDWRGGQVYVVTTVEDAVVLVGNLRRHK